MGRNKVLFTYIASLLRSVRFGTESSQGKAAAVQLNKYLEDNAIVHLGSSAGKDSGKFQVNFRKLEESVKNRVKEFVTLQHGGVKPVVDFMLEKYGNLNDRMKETLKRLKDVPVDIRRTNDRQAKGNMETGLSRRFIWHYNFGGQSSSAT